MTGPLPPETPLADPRFHPGLRPDDPGWGAVPLVIASRNGVIESIHQGAIAVCDVAGNLLAWRGDVQIGCYLRSGAKPFQAVPLFGRADLLAQFGFSPEEMALMVSSHLGEPRHVEAGASLFRKLGLDPYAVLKNGPDRPHAAREIAALYRAGGEPTVLHHNCSGNHGVFLAQCVAEGHDLARYQWADHPVQQPMHGLMAALLGVPRTELHIGVDNCGVPAYWCTLRAAATAFARLANPAATAQLGLELPIATDAFVHGARKVAGAMWSRPEYTAGAGHLTTWVGTHGAGRFFGKNGAEGFYGIGAAAPSEYPHLARPAQATWSAAGPLQESGFGIALKIGDGDRQERGTANAVLASLVAVGLLYPSVLETESTLLQTERRTHRGDRWLGATYPAFTELEWAS